MKTKGQVLKKKTRSSNGSLHPDYHDTDQGILDAMTVTLKEAITRAELQDLHESRVDNLLRSIGLCRQPVPSDGDCFYSDALLHLVDIKSTATLRYNVCTHMKMQKD